MGSIIRVVVILLLAGLAWIAWGKYEQRERAERNAEVARQLVPKKKPGAPAKTVAAADGGVSFFTCDGRSACKQMTSCEEAKYFVKTCPGFNSGVFGEEASCEKQWCKK